jgi:hypothetical protein
MLKKNKKGLKHNAGRALHSFGDLLEQGYTLVVMGNGSDKARQVLGYAPEYDAKAGFAAACEWYWNHLR